MAAEVSSIVRLMADGEDNTSRDLITRDFLGCAAAAGSKELDLDLKVPSGWERRLDLLSGETYFEKSSGPDPVPRGLQDLNLPPPPAADSSALDLKILLPSCHRAFDYQSVCTLDKVRSALERAGRESRGRRSQRSDGSGSPSSSTTSSSSAANKRRSGDQEAAEGKGSDGPSLMVAGCPSCLMYVLISRVNPRCPRCDSHVPATVTAVAKKPRIDLNFTT